MIANKVVRLALMLLLAQVVAFACAFAASVAAKNKEGNRLFQQGKYQDAEKAYVDAQLEAPGRPALFLPAGSSWLAGCVHPSRA